MTRPDLTEIQRTIAASRQATRDSRKTCATAGKVLSDAQTVLQQAQHSLTQTRLVLNEQGRCL